MDDYRDPLIHKIGWVVANSLGTPVIVFILFMLLGPAKDSGGLIGLFILFCGTGSLLGIAQALSLRPWVSPVWWVLATALGSGTSIFAFAGLIRFSSPLVFGLFIASIGVFQSLAMRNQGKRVYFWIVFNFLGLGLAGIGGVAMFNFFMPSISWDTPLPSFEQIFTILFVFGLIYGVVTQFFLFRLLRRLR